MAEGVFGKAGNLSFTATRGPRGEVVAPDALISMSIYADTPTDAQIADDTNALAAAAFHTSTAWVSGPNTYERLIAYDAIDDPEPTSSDKWELYYAVVRYRLESGEQIQRDTISLVLHRSQGIGSRFDVGESDLSVLERKIPDLLSTIQIGLKIDVAERFVVNALQSRGIDMQRLDWASGKDLVRFKAAKLCCMDLSNEAGDEWWVKAEAYYKAYEGLLDNLVLQYDSDDDGDIEPLEQTQSGNGLQFLFR